MEINKLVIFNLCGKLDSNTAEEVKEKIMPLLAEDTNLIFNLEECDYVSSAGLRILVIAAKKMKTFDKDCVIFGLSDEVKKVFKFTGFDKLFVFFTNVHDAIEGKKYFHI